MSIKFTGRENELKFMEEEYNKEGFRFIPIYGRRRVGKTELIKQFIKNKRAIYYLADKSKENIQIDSLKKIASEVLQDELLNALDFKDFESLFKYISEKTGNYKDKTIIVIDEFPYLIDINNAIPSIFQKIVDLYLSKSNVLLILCGSSVSLMERHVLSYKAPLYGRRTGQIDLKPFTFRESTKMLSGKNMEEIIKIYAITGGIPLYLNIMNEKGDVFKLIENKIVKKNEFLNIEAEFLLKEEFRTPHLYFSIMKALAIGKNKPNEIATYINEPVTSLPKYLETLERLNYVKRFFSLFDNPLKSKKSLYYLSDPYMQFWFRFIYPNKSYIEQENYKYVMNQIKREFNLFISRIFESIAMEFLIYKKIMDFDKIGNVWGIIPYAKKGRTTYEIDVLGINENTKEMIAVEVKWKDLGLKEVKEIIEELKEKVRYVDWFNNERKERLGIFAKKINKRAKEWLKENGYMCWDLQFLEKEIGKLRFKQQN